MQFTSIYFILFIIICLSGYYCFPKKFQYIFLLGCNIIFYLSWTDSPAELLPLAIVIFLTWGGAELLHRKQSSGILLAVIIICSVAFLAYFKYAGFVIANLNNILEHTDLSKINDINPLAPIGISFFTFQALGYVIDVYHRKTDTEKNIIRYAAYVSFFPTITSGPIERSNSLLAQMQDKKGKVFNYDNLRRGLIIAAYGAFIKLIISDRLSIIVDTVFGNYEVYGGAVLFIAAISYTLQIYCDFSSYSLLARGVAECLGFHVIENFKAPYFAESVQEFWRRWHISLSTWFRDYVYISLGGNRCSKFRKNMNLFITFLVSGVWHGANWTFIFWGCLHGIYQIVGNSTKQLREKLTEKFDINTQCFSFHLWKRACVFLLVSFAWIFFRSESISDAYIYISRIFTDIKIWEIFDGTIYNLGLNNLQLDILKIALLLFVGIDYVKYKTDKGINELLEQQNMLFRCLVVSAMIIFTLVFGMYGPAFNAQDFIYFRF